LLFSFGLVAKDNLALRSMMLKPKKISKVLLSAFIGPFIITFIVSLFVFELQFIWVYMDDLMGKGLDTWIILQLLIYASARIVNMALPLAILMSSIMAIGALSENNELTAMKSAGLSLTQIFKPLIIFIIGISVTAFLFANNVWPIANLKFRTLLFSIMQQKPALNISEGVFYNGIEGISIRVKNKNNDTGELSDILIYDHRQPGKGNRSVIRAEKGKMEQTADKRWLILTLQNGVSYDEIEEKKNKTQKYPAIHSSFQEMTLRVDLSSLFFKEDDEEVFKNAFEMMTITQLNQALIKLNQESDSTTLSNQARQINKLRLQPNAAPVIAGHSLFSQFPATLQSKAVSNAVDVTKKQISASGKDESIEEENKKFYARHLIEWHRKFFLGISCIVLFMIGAPLGAIIRKGGLGLPSVIALLMFIIFELLTISGEKMAKALIISPSMGMWMSTLVMAPIALWIMFAAQKEKKWNLTFSIPWLKKLKFKKRDQ
jgi:lipopolysaccharide export system permease protein